jgi:hypothetical protein
MTPLSDSSCFGVCCKCLGCNRPGCRVFKDEAVGFVCFGEVASDGFGFGILGGERFARVPGDDTVGEGVGVLALDGGRKISPRPRGSSVTPG